MNNYGSQGPKPYVMPPADWSAVAPQPPAAQPPAGTGLVWRAIEPPPQPAPQPPAPVPSTPDGVFVGGIEYRPPQNEGEACFAYYLESQARMYSGGRSSPGFGLSFSPPAQPRLGVTPDGRPFYLP